MNVQGAVITVLWIVCLPKRAFCAVPANEVQPARLRGADAVYRPKVHALNTRSLLADAAAESPATAPKEEYPESVEIFSALHDTVNGEVRIFAAVYPERRCGEIQFCRYSIEDDIHEDFPAGTLIPFAEPEGETVECFRSCELHPERVRESPPKTRVTLLDGDRKEMHEGVEIEKLEVAGSEHKGVGMCVGPIFSESPQFLDWLTFWSKIGLKGIHAYVPLYEEDDPAVQNLGLGQSYRRPRLPMHNLLSWTTYNPAARSNYHSQKMAYNDCIYRNRHLYDFIIIMDIDEFIYFQPDANYTGNLNDWLFENTPEDNAALCLQEYLSPPIRCYQHSNYPLNTAARQRQMKRIEYSIRYKGYSIVKEVSGPLSSPLEKCTDHEICRFKCIIRPLAVRAYNVHGLQHIEDGWRGHAYVDPVKAVFKHVRCRGGSMWE